MKTETQKNRFGSRVELIVLFLILFINHMTYGQDIIRNHGFVAITKQNDCPAKINVFIVVWHGTDSYLKWFKVWVSVDGGSDQLVLDYTARPVVGDWTAYFPNSTCTAFSDATANWHSYNIHIPAGQNVKVKCDGAWNVYHESHDFDGEGTITFPSPGSPTDIEISQDCSSNTISWGAADNGDLECPGESYYQVYRKGSGDSSSKWLTNTTSTSYKDSSPTGNDAYKVCQVYKPEADTVTRGIYLPNIIHWHYGGQNMYSKFTAEKRVTSLSPTTPSDLSASTDKCTEIKLNWKQSGSPDVIKIYRSSGSSFTEIGEVGGVFRTYSDEPANPQNGNSYGYKIRAFNGECSSGYSNTITGRTYGDPTLPGNFSASTGAGSIDLSWSDSDNESRYLIKRTSSTGDVEFEIGENETSYTDKSVNGCEKYTYQLYAGNKCTEQGSSGIKALNEPKGKIRPDLSEYLTSADASKAYYPDKVLIEWTVKDGNVDLTDNFTISRSIAGENSFESIGSVSGLTIFEDYSATGGILYEYRVTANLNCEGESMSSNTLTSTGFRMPFGIVNGHIEYQNGVSVTGVEVLAEKTSGFPVGHSLRFDGNSEIFVFNDEKLNPGSYMVAEAWILPSTLEGAHSILSKNGCYQLEQFNSSLGFEVFIDNTNREVYAVDVLKPGVFTHVAGVLDSVGLKIYVNGKIPSITTYSLLEEDFEALAAMEMEEDILQKLVSVLGIVYDSYETFESAVSSQIGETELQRNMPLLITRAQRTRYKEESILEIDGSITENTHELSIGSGFEGCIDEIRLWNTSRNEAEILNDYKRIVANDEPGIAAYWRCDENFGTQIFDASKSGGFYHKNDGAFFGNISFDPNIPNNSQLGWIGTSDENGDYTIPYVPYLGSGENFRITPRYETHQFQPNTSTLFLGEGASIQNGKDFTDISSFKVTGIVYYEGTTCGVEGVTLNIDGEAVIKDGAVVMTDDMGEFEIEVPVGDHYISVSKSGHTFKSFKFPPGPAEFKYNFQEAVTGINYIDKTKQKIVGRIVGGTVQGDKVPALGLSENNIGVGEFDLISVTGPACSSYPVETDPKTGEYEVMVPPMKYYIRNFSVPSNPDVKRYFGEFEIADFSNVAPDYEVEYEHPTKRYARIEMHRLDKVATLDIAKVDSQVVVPLEIIDPGTERMRGRFVFNDEIYEYQLDSIEITTTVTDSLKTESETVNSYYNYQLDFIYRTPPQIRVTAADGESPVTGDKTIQWEDRRCGKMKDFDVENNPFQYPVFTQGKQYTIQVALDEVYYNQDICEGFNGCEEATEDRVAVNDGEIEIYNQLAVEKSPSAVEITAGKAFYTFTAGYPVLMTDSNYPWRNYSGVINITANLDGNGYPWYPYNTTSPETMPFQYEHEAFPHVDDKYFRGYVLGSKAINGSDFYTNGPAIVDNILRDPPGSESYSFIEEGTSYSYTESVTMGGGMTVDENLKISLGTEVWVGLGVMTNQSQVNDITLGVSVENAWDVEQGNTNTTTFTSTLSTSPSPILTGAPSDLFIGKSQNYVISVADNLSVFPLGFADSTGLETSGSPSLNQDNPFVICRQKSLLANPDGFPTSFIYSGDHIENYLIPNLISLRNNLFLTQAGKYTSKLSTDHEMYGTNNDDPLWYNFDETPVTSTPYTTQLADYDGPSYTFVPENTDDPDEIRKYNEQIRLWEEALERNEQEKYNAELVENISFNGGTTIEKAMSTEKTVSTTSSWEINVNTSFLWEFGFEVGGIGLENSLGLQGNFHKNVTQSSEVSTSKTFGYVLSDPDIGDYYSIDIKDAKTGTGPVFSVKGGRSMCPHEGPLEPEYFVPGKYTIDNQALTTFRNLGMNDTLIDILSWNATGYYKMNSIDDNFDFNISQGLLSTLGNAPVKLKQIKDQQFNTEAKLIETITMMINMKIPASGTISTGFGSTKYDIAELSGKYLEITDHVDAQSGNFEFYLFTNKQREKLYAEFLSYLPDIKLWTHEADKTARLLSEGTIRREVPVASISPSVQYNIPDDNKAYFTLSFGNESYTDEGMGYEAAVLEESNPDGAVIKIDGGTVNRVYSIDAGSSINKTLSVEMGKPDVYDYENLQVVLYSSCEMEYADNGADLSDEAIDTVTFSVHFVPSCTDIEIVMPEDMFIINNEDEHLVEGIKETKVPVMMSGYDQTNQLFEKLNFQFKSAADPEWTKTTDFWMRPPDTEDEIIPGKYTAVEWDLSGFPDGEYNLRAKTYCGRTPDGTEIFDLSEVWTGMVDRKAPEVFGTPQPADGILSPDDDIMIEFNEEIFGEKLTNLANFDIRGILNGTDLRHDVSVAFYDDTSDFVRIPDGINLGGKSFTIEFWLYGMRSFTRECILSQNTDPVNSLWIEFTEQGYIDFHIGDQTYTLDNINTGQYTDEWHHYAFVYDDVRNEAIIMMDGVPLGTGSLKPVYTGYGDMYLGKSMINEEHSFMGRIHEIRIWERPRTASAITANMLITLSGKETGLIGYWPLNEACDILASDKVHKRNATVNAPWLVTPAGLAAEFQNQTNAMMNMNFSDIAFSPEEDFSIEFWFKSNKGANTCFLSNGHGDENDKVLYYYSIYDLALTASVLPLEENIESLLSPIVSTIYSSQNEFLSAIALYLGNEKTENYTEQLLRFGKHLPTYWSINTDESGNIQVNNNGKRIKTKDENLFDNRWHHFAMVVQRTGNTRLYLDGNLSESEPSTEWNGFGAARLFVGARGLFKQSLPGYEFDQYFTGYMDELRIWNTALKQSQIERNRTMRLDGDELGLVAYFPFENYEEIMGVPIINSTIEDMITHDSIRNINNDHHVWITGTDVPNVRMKRPSSKVDFSFVAQEEKIAFVLNEPNAKIENCILDITTKNVEDMYGNKMNSPVTWSAYIDRNQVKWGDSKFNLEKEIYAPMSFTTKIINYSGEQQFYTLEGIPDWVTAVPSEGTLDPLSEQLVTFTLSEGVNVGSYSKDISLKTDFGFDEKLQISLRVFEPLPGDWILTPEDYQFSMNMIGYISINGITSADPFDQVAAFVDGKCRGIANLMYIEDYDMYQVYLDIYSNESYGENVELHIWDAGSGVEYRGVTADGLSPAPPEYGTKYKFISNEIYGAPFAPVALEANSLTIRKLPLNAGWNWKSFNLSMDKGKTFDQLLEGCNFTENDRIKGLTSYTEYVGSWIGSLNMLEPEEMYMFKVKNEDTLKVSGVPIDPLTTPVPVYRGWNWIGYIPSVNIAVNDAMGQFTPNRGDVLKSQFAFAMYDPFMGWIGTLDYMRPGYGYKYRYLESISTPDKQLLYYPRTGSSLKAGVKDDEKDIYPAFNNWTQYSSNMSVIAKIAGVDKQSPEDEIRVYSSDTLRGMVNPIVLPDNEYIYFLTVYGEKTRDKLDFVYISAEGEASSVNETLYYVSDSIAGTTNNPVILTLNQESTGFIPCQTNLDYRCYPNPFCDELKIDINLSFSEDAEISLLDALGKTVKIIKLEGKKKHSAWIKTTEIKPGIYMLKIKTGKLIKYKKVIRIE